MSAVNALKTILVDDVIIPLTKEKSKNCCVLSEAKANYSYEIHSVPDDMLVIHCDKFPDTGKFFKGKNNECKRADYVLISDSERAIMIFELIKSNSKSAGKVTDQLKGAKCILDYCESISLEFLGKNDIFVDYTYRYYKVVSTMAKKRAFSEYERTENTKPELHKKLSGSFARFEWLL